MFHPHFVFLGIYMMKNFRQSFFRQYLLLATLFISTVSVAQVPRFGSDTLLDVGCWNLEWFGSTGYGPTNEQLQFNNIRQVLNNTDIDVWGLAEVADTEAYQQLLSALPQYGGILATYSQTQKTALFYKKELFEVFSYNHFLTASSHNYNFAGRPPLEVGLVTKAPLEPDTIYFIVVHLKAYADQESYDRRKGAAASLKAIHLDPHRKHFKTVVLGDWNDDLDVATYNGLETPFQIFLDDPENYFFTTKQLSDEGKKSYAFINGSMIDHILVTSPMHADYIAESANVLDMMPVYISNFSQNTSDHFPVISSFKLAEGHTAGLPDQSSAKNTIGISSDRETIFAIGEWTGTVELYTVDGIKTGEFEKRNEQTVKISIQHLPRGMYIAVLQGNSELSTHKFVR